MNTFGQTESECVIEQDGDSLIIKSCTMNKISFKEYLDGIGAQLTDYQTLIVHVDALDAEGNVLDIQGDYEKVALVSEGKLNGFESSDIVKSNYKALGSDVVYDLTNVPDPEDEDSVMDEWNNAAGFNIQMNNLYGATYEDYAPAAIKISVTLVKKVTPTSNSAVNVTMNTYGAKSPCKVVALEDGKIQVYGATMNSFDFVSYLTEQGIKLSECKSLKIKVDAIDAAGNIIEDPEVDDDWQCVKIAMVSAAKMDGYSDPDIDKSKWSAFGAEKVYDLTNVPDPTDEDSMIEEWDNAAGLNIQIHGYLGVAGIQISELVIEK